MSQPVRVPHQVRRDSVAVLVDGSPGSDAAVGWAAREADRRGLTLTLLQALGARPDTRPDEIQALDHALGLARSSAQQLDVRVRVEATPAWPLVVDASDAMASIVLSQEAAEDVPDRITDARTRAAADEPRCPVLVVASDGSGIEVAPLDGRDVVGPQV
jgi:nucleotide-binding universal stress UspA family protein